MFRLLWHVREVVTVKNILRLGRGYRVFNLLKSRLYEVPTGFTGGNVWVYLGYKEKVNKNCRVYGILTCTKLVQVGGRREVQEVLQL